jgi:hypothetical protein
VFPGWVELKGSVVFPGGVSRTSGYGGVGEEVVHNVNHEDFAVDDDVGIIH